MLLKTGLIIRIQQCIHSDRWFHVLPFKWDEQEGQLTVANAQSSKFYSAGSFLYFLVAGCSMLLSSFHRKEAQYIAETSLTMVTAVILLCCATMCRKLVTDHFSIIGILNGLIKLENEMEEDRTIIPLDLTMKLVQWTGQVIAISAKCYPLLLSVGAGLDTGLPINTFGIFLYNVDQKDGLLPYWPFLFRGLTVLGNLIVWHIVCIIGMFFCLEMLATYNFSKGSSTQFLKLYENFWIH
ncbi:unnamed protein product [Orchesella dallaii]|uniref:Uncharacterized protein n=1 Tax=Orchesella dallaii TaxID=48710 RepID=A0ABP1R3U7_9HEXA